MTGDKDCLCGGTGKIFDYSVWGDPCPECDGRPMRLSARVKIKKGTSGCVVVLLAVMSALGAVATAVDHLL
jgi:hypothetical protein